MPAWCINCFYVLLRLPLVLLFFFFHDTATTEIYTLSLHDALPICKYVHVDWQRLGVFNEARFGSSSPQDLCQAIEGDRKSTRLNSSHTVISYAVFCLKKKKKKNNTTRVVPLQKTSAYRAHKT